MTTIRVQSVERYTLAALLSSFSQYDLFEELDWQVQEALGHSTLPVITSHIEFELRGDLYRSPEIERIFGEPEPLGLAFLMPLPGSDYMYFIRDGEAMAEGIEDAHIFFTEENFELLSVYGSLAIRKSPTYIWDPVLNSRARIQRSK
jgi:hypothetical protein